MKRESVTALKLKRSISGISTSSKCCLRILAGRVSWRLKIGMLGGIFEVGLSILWSVRIKCLGWRYYPCLCKDFAWVWTLTSSFGLNATNCFRFIRVNPRPWVLLYTLLFTLRLRLRLFVVPRSLFELGYLKATVTLGGSLICMSWVFISDTYLEAICCSSLCLIGSLLLKDCSLSFFPLSFSLLRKPSYLFSLYLKICFPRVIWQIDVRNFCRWTMLPSFGTLLIPDAGEAYSIS